MNAEKIPAKAATKAPVKTTEKAKEAAVPNPPTPSTEVTRSGVPAVGESAGDLRIAGVAEPVDEPECRVSGCRKAPERLGLCPGHYASRRGEGLKPAREEADRG